MAESQVLRNNQIKGLSYCLNSAIAKHLLCPGIPITNLPLPIGNKNRIDGTFKQLLEQSIYASLPN